MRQSDRKRDPKSGRLLKETRPPATKQGITFDEENYRYIRQFMKEKGIKKFSRAVNELLYYLYREAGIDIDVADSSMNTDVSAPVNTSGCTESNIVLGNANNTTISKKSRSQRGHLPRERE